MSLLIEFPTSRSISLGDDDSGAPGNVRVDSGGVAVSEFYEASLPTETVPRSAVGSEGGEAREGFAALAIPDSDPARILLPMQWNKFCDACERDCIFAACGVCGEGLVVECTGCGVPRVSPFTRMNSEVA